MSDDYYTFNKVKRERIRKMAIQDAIANMRQNLPIYKLEEIREYKMPYYEALVTNLEEKGLVSSASFLKQLVQFQNEAREEAGPGSNVWMRPQLRFSNKELKLLTEELQKAEQFNTSGAHVKECDTFLRLGIHFAFGHSDWWWLGEQILVQSIYVSGNYPSSLANFEALSRFAYAKFLIKNVKEYETAKEQLLIARELAAVKGQCISSYFPDERSGTLYMLINYYTHKCLMKEIRSLIPYNYKQAIELTVLAKKRAAEACYKEGETQALLLKGLCEMNLDNAKSAIFSFNKALKLEEETENKENLCKVMIQLAKAYLMDNNTSQSLRVLNRLKDTAAKYRLHFYLAQAYKNMGEHYLNNAEYSVARRLLNKSMSYFEEDKDASSDIAFVQILEAIAWGFELFPKYVDLVYNSGNTSGPMGIENLNKLIEWKDSRQPFWGEMSPETSLADMMTADQQIVRPSTLRIEEYKAERRLLIEAKKLALEAVKQGIENEEVMLKEIASEEEMEKTTIQQLVLKQEGLTTGIDVAESGENDLTTKKASRELGAEVIEIHDNKVKFLTSDKSFNNDDRTEDNDNQNTEDQVI